MPAAPPPNRATELQRLLAELTGHTAAHVRPYGKHLLIQVKRDDSLDTVARLTESSRNYYTSAFRTHSGRWEPLPAAGNLRQTAEAVVSMLASYFDPEM